jgi:hypothetical protein
MSERQLTKKCGEARSKGDLAPHQRRRDHEHNTRHKVEADARNPTTRTSSDLDAKRRDTRENGGYEGEMLGGLDAAETSDVDLQQDIAIIGCGRCQIPPRPSHHERATGKPVSAHIQAAH